MKRSDSGKLKDSFTVDMDASLLEIPANRVFHPYVTYFPIEEIPEDLTVGVLGVQLADSHTWGTVPARFPTPVLPRRIPPQALKLGSPADFDTPPSPSSSFLMRLRDSMILR